MSGVALNAEAADETILRIGFMQKVDSLNPLIGLNDASYIFYSLLYDTLQVIGNDYETVGNLATDWKIVPTTDPQLVISGEPYGSVWEYTITQNATWHDKEPFTVDDVLYTLNMNAFYYDSMWANQPYAYFMKYAEKSGDNTVRVHFYDRETGESQPAAYAHLISIMILPKHKLQSMTTYDVAFNWSGVFAGNDPPMVGTGPFKVTEFVYDEWLGGDYVTLVRNPDYHWQVDHGKSIQFDRLRMYFYDEATAMRLALEHGDLDVAQLPPHEYRTLESDLSSGKVSGITIFDDIRSTGYWTEIGVNMNDAGPNPSRLDPTIRQALAMATDKQYIVDNFYFGYADVGTTLISPVNTEWHYEPTDDEKFPFDIDAANAMLEAAGYVDNTGDGIREATLASYAVQNNLVMENTPLVYQMLIRREYPEERDIALYLDQKWREIGVDLDVQIISEAAMATIVYTYTYDTFIWYWSSDVDPNYQLFVQTKMSFGGWSDNMYTNPAYEENYSKSVREMDREKRKEYVDNCQRINYRDAAYIIIAYPYQTYGWRDDTFTGYGNWSDDPGRSVDNWWTGNPLYFDLVPLDGTEDKVPWALIGLGVGVVAAIAAAVVALVLRGKKKGETGESPLGD